MGAAPPNVPEVYGIGGIAARLHVSRQWVRQLYTTGRLPSPDLTMIDGSRRRPLWHDATIDPWIAARLSARASATD